MTMAYQILDIRCKALQLAHIKLANHLDCMSMDIAALHMPFIMDTVRDGVELSSRKSFDVHEDKEEFLMVTH